MAARVAFFGYGELGVAGLDTLVGAGADVAAAIVPINRNGDQVAAVGAAAALHGIPILVQPVRQHIGPFVDTLRSARPDLIVVCSYSMLLPKALVELPALGAVNVHSGLLPEYRGGHVVQWAIINGAHEFGVTLHFMDEGIDTGPVIAEQRFPIFAEDDALSVRRKIQGAASALLEEWWVRLAAGTAPRVPQDAARARYWPMRTPEEGRIDWTAAAESISRLVRALRCNTPGAYVAANGRRISIRRVTIDAAREDGLPGRVVAIDGDVVRVASSDDDVLILEADVEGEPLAGTGLADALSPTHG